mgnify:FL=1
MANNNENKILNVPNLRFPEFTNEWGNITIKEACSEFQSGKNIKAEMITGQGLYPVYGGNGLRGFTESYNHDGDYILIGRQGALCGNIRKVTGKTYVTEHAIAVCASKENETTFLQYLFQKMKLGQYSDQSAQPGLAVNKLLRLNINVPSKIEQAKIAKILSLIDERIITQNKIIEDLKKLKSAIYQELFSNQQGEEYSLSELVEIIKGQQINGNELSENGKYYVMNGGIMPSGYYDDYNTEAGTISISEGGNSCGYVQYNSSKFWSGGHCYTLHIKPAAPISTLFLFHFLKWKETDIMTLRIGSGLPNIQKKDLSKVSIIVPTLDKQQRIMTLLSTFQMKIEHEDMYAINLNKQKQYLLSQMFI